MSLTVDVRSAPRSAAEARRAYRPSRIAATLVFLAVGLPSVEGYVHAINGQANKLVPVLLVGYWGLTLMLERRWPRMQTLSWAGVALIALVSMATAFNPTNAIRMELYIRWIPFLVVLIALIDLMSTKVHPRVAVYAMGFGAMAAGFGALFSFVVLGAPRANGPLEDPNDLAYVLTAALPMLLVGFAAAPQRWMRVTGLVGAGICVLGAAATMSRGGLLAMATLLLWGWLRHLVKPRHVAIGAVVAAVLGALTFAVAGDSIQTALDQKTHIAQGNVDQREMRWAGALRGLSDNPVFGMGPGGASQNYVRNSNLAEIAEMTPATHNMYVETAAELGVPAFVVFVFLIAATVFYTKDYYPKDRPWALAAQGSILAIAVSSTFLSQEYYMPLWATVAIAGALELRRRQKETR